MGVHHSHDHGHSHSKEHYHALNKAFIIAIVLNLAYTGCQVVYALMANSMSLLADAVHNFGDVLGLVLAFMANWLLSIPARKRYSYGFKRTTIIAALANAFILVATSALILYHSVNKLFHLSEINSTIVIWVGLIGIVVNAGSSVLFLRDSHSDLNVRGAFLHLLSDAIISFGVVVGALCIRYTNVYWIDPVLGIVIVLIILWGTWGLLRDSLNLILDAVPHYIDSAGVRDYLATLPGVTSVHDLHIWGLSTREVALTVHLIMPEKTLSDDDYHQINHDLQDQFRINHVTIQVEKGTSDDPCGRVISC